MVPLQLLPLVAARHDGQGPEVRLRSEYGTLLRLGFNISRISERQGIQLEIWGSTDGTDWGWRPLLTVPTKYYCGHYSYDLDLTTRPDIRFLRAAYHLRNDQPLKTALEAHLSVTAEVHQHAMAAAALA